jgi:hypothetical protein
MPTKKEEKSKKMSVFKAPSFYPASFNVPPTKVIDKLSSFSILRIHPKQEKILPHGQVR